MMSFLKTFIKKVISLLSGLINLSGYKFQISKVDAIGIPIENQEIYNAVKNYTMTSPERVSALIDSVRYVIKNNIEGAFVECGVWKGGSAMTVALTLKSLGIVDRDIYLFDTFEGMPEPGQSDISIGGDKATDTFNRLRLNDDSSAWCFSPINEVIENMNITGYPAERIKLIKGKVEETVPANMPSIISLLRLDTDWYDSTKHELINMYPVLTKNGVLIIDDYGFWQGAKKAVDEYIESNSLSLYLHRVDDTGRVAIKT